jgi:hypothetical protein
MSNIGQPNSWGASPNPKLLVLTESTYHGKEFLMSSSTCRGQVSDQIFLVLQMKEHFD